MLRRLRSLQEQCRSKKTLPERPFCNIGQTSQLPQTPIANGSVSFRLNSVDAASTPKENSSLLPLNCVDVIIQDTDDLPSVTEKSAKRTCSETDSSGTVTNVNCMTSPTSVSPPRKRLRQDTVESLGSENGVCGAVGGAALSSNTAVLASEKLSAVATSPAEKSVDSINVELSSSVVCETSAASNASVRRSGSYSQLTSFSRPASVVRSANSSPRTWPSRRDLGQSFVVFIYCYYIFSNTTLGVLEHSSSCCCSNPDVGTLLLCISVYAVSVDVLMRAVDLHKTAFR